MANDPKARLSFWQAANPARWFDSEDYNKARANANVAKWNVKSNVRDAYYGELEDALIGKIEDKEAKLVARQEALARYHAGVGPHPDGERLIKVAGRKAVNGVGSLASGSVNFVSGAYNKTTSALSRGLKYGGLAALGTGALMVVGSMAGGGARGKDAKNAARREAEENLNDSANLGGQTLLGDPMAMGANPTMGGQQFNPLLPTGVTPVHGQNVARVRGEELGGFVQPEQNVTVPSSVQSLGGYSKAAEAGANVAPLLG